MCLSKGRFAMITQQNDGLYRKLPQVGELLCHPELQVLFDLYPRELITDFAREAVDDLRNRLRQEAIAAPELDEAIAELPQRIGIRVGLALAPSLRPVINATGVLLQTNLGRAPLCRQALERMAEVAAGYCNLEFDLDTGERGMRGAAIERLLLRLLATRQGIAMEKLFASKSALIVNNCAAATFLALQSLADGGEVVVSRGELVEIGGGFRIPDILRKAGAVLREVGTTNRTRIGDYAAAITPATRLLLRVHRSNFRIEGFTEQAPLNDLIALGKQRSVPVFEDQGTGCAVHLDQYGIKDQAYWPGSAASDLDLVACSADKLFGGPQCGILIGTRDIIETIRRNPLYRALRVDKLTCAALEGTLLTYLAEGEQAMPLFRMLGLPREMVERRCRAVAAKIGTDDLDATVIPTSSVVGGGTTPGASVPSYAIALRHASLDASALAAELRRLAPPIVARVNKEQVLLDLRTVAEEQDELLIRSMSTLPSDSTRSKLR